MGELWRRVRDLFGPPEVTVQSVQFACVDCMTVCDFAELQDCPDADDPTRSRMLCPACAGYGGALRRFIDSLPC